MANKQKFKKKAQNDSDQVKDVSRSFRDIFILAWIHDILSIDGTNMAHKDKKPHADDTDGQGRSHAIDSRARKGFAQGDGRNGKARVGKDHCPPAQVKARGRRPNNRKEGNAEEPKAQSPEECTRNQGQDLDRASVFSGIRASHHTKCGRQPFRHPDES